MRVDRGMRFFVYICIVKPRPCRHEQCKRPNVTEPVWEDHAQSRCRANRNLAGGLCGRPNQGAHKDTTKTVDTKLHHLATKEDVANLRTELKTDMKDLKIDMIKWMISLFVWQTSIILGLVYFLFKAMQDY